MISVKYAKHVTDLHNSQAICPENEQAHAATNQMIGDDTAGDTSTKCRMWVMLHSTIGSDMDSWSAG